MSYLDYIKDELTYRYFGYLFMSVFFFIALYRNGVSPLNTFLYICALLIFSVLSNSHMRYKEKRISLSESLTMTYLDYLKHEFKYNYSHFLICTIIFGSILFFTNASFLTIFLSCAGLFFAGLAVSAYAKTFYRRFK